MIKNIQKWIVLLSLVTVTFFLSSCNNNSKTQQTKKKQTTITAKLETPTKQLFYNGVLNPIDTYAVTSPVSGTITKLNFTYGEEIKQGAVLAVLSSKELADNFRKTVTDFLQKKDAYDNAIQSYQGTVALYKAGIISKENFLSEKSQYENTVLSYFQSRFSLMQVSMQAKISGMDIARLQLSDFKTIHQLLKKQFDQIDVVSPKDGVALFPTPDQNTSGSGNSQGQQSGELQVGSQVKSGQLMLSIGDLSGMSAKINVNEININRIQKGMAASVTGDAFPGITLKGVVASVSSQANPQQGGGGDGGAGQSLFAVLIKIPTLTPEQQKIIHVGMTAKIQIDIQDKPTILLPIKAVTVKNGGHTVTIIDASGKTQQVSVVVGSTTPDGKIRILSGVKAGDKVVVFN